MTTLAELLALLPDNTAGDISAADMRDVTTGLWNDAPVAATDSATIDFSGSGTAADPLTASAVTGTSAGNVATYDQVLSEALTRVANDNLRPTIANNLSDMASIPACRTNLGISDVNTPATVNGSLTGATVRAQLTELDTNLTALPELAVDDPTEVGLTTAAGTTTLELLPPIARKAAIRTFASGYFYWSAFGTVATATPVVDTCYWQPIILDTGTLDRIGWEVTTAGAAGAVGRAGLYTNSGGFPGALIGETAAQVQTSIAVITVNTSWVVPAMGIYWMAYVSQVAGTTVVRSVTGGSATAIPMIPLGTTPPGVNTTGSTRSQTGVTTNLPNPAATTAFNLAMPIRFHFRYA